MIADTGKEVDLVNVKFISSFTEIKRRNQNRVSNILPSSKVLLSGDERKNHFNAFTNEEEVTKSEFGSRPKI